MTIKYLTISRTLLMSGITRWLSIDNKISYHFTNSSHEWCHKMIKYWQPNILPFHELFSWVVSPNILPFHEMIKYWQLLKYLTISRTLLMSVTRWLSIKISYHFTNNSHEFCHKRWLSIDNSSQISYHFTNSSHEWCHKMI